MTVQEAISNLRAYAKGYAGNIRGMCALAADLLESNVPRWISVEERLPEHWHMDDKDVGETVTFFDNERQLQALTGLDHNGLWDAGFDLDDWDYGFVTVEEWPDPGRMMGANVTEYQWHIMNLCELRHVEYQGRHYYMWYHA